MSTPSCIDKLPSNRVRKHHRSTSRRPELPFGRKREKEISYFFAWILNVFCIGSLNGTTSLQDSLSSADVCFPAKHPNAFRASSLPIQCLWMLLFCNVVAPFTSSFFTEKRSEQNTPSRISMTACTFEVQATTENIKKRKSLLWLLYHCKKNFRTWTRQNDTLLKKYFKVESVHHDSVVPFLQMHTCSFTDFQILFHSYCSHTRFSSSVIAFNIRRKRDKSRGHLIDGKSCMLSILRMPSSTCHWICNDEYYLQLLLKTYIHGSIESMWSQFDGHSEDKQRQNHKMSKTSSTRDSLFKESNIWPGFEKSWGSAHVLGVFFSCDHNLMFLSNTALNVRCTHGSYDFKRA